MAQDATMAVDMLNPFLRRLRDAGPAVERAAVDRGLAILAEAGLSTADLSDPELRIPHRVGVALLEDGLRTTSDPAFALRAGASVQPDEFGLYEYVCSTASTLRESMQAASRYLPLLHDGAEVDLVEDGEFALWRHRLFPTVAAPPSANEYVVAAFFVRAQRMLGLDGPPTEVHFVHEQPAHAAAYEALFRAPVRFGRDRNAIVMPKIALDLPLVGSSPGLHRVLVRYADELLTRVPKRHPFTRRVRALVRERLAEGASLTSVAAALHMSERSLRRRLLLEGITHSEIVDAVRRETALELLGQPELNISEIAFALGFAHRPAFHRALKRWYGSSPTELRARRTGNAFARFYERSPRPTGDEQPS